MKSYPNTTMIYCLLIAMGILQGHAATDPYPKNPNIDALHYRFEFELSDDTDEIKGRTTVDVRFLTDSIHTTTLRSHQKKSLHCKIRA